MSQVSVSLPPVSAGMADGLAMILHRNTAYDTNTQLSTMAMGGGKAYSE